MKEVDKKDTSQVSGGVKPPVDGGGCIPDGPTFPVFPEYPRFPTVPAEMDDSSRST